MRSDLLTIPMICEELGIGRTTAYKLIKSGEIPSGRIGREIIVHRSALDEFIKKTISEKKDTYKILL